MQNYTKSSGQRTTGFSAQLGVSVDEVARALVADHLRAVVSPEFVPGVSIFGARQTGRGASIAGGDKPSKGRVHRDQWAADPGIGVSSQNE